MSVIRMGNSCFVGASIPVTPECSVLLILNGEDDSGKTMYGDLTLHAEGAVCFVERATPSCVCVRLEGELDAHSVPVLEAGLAHSLEPEYQRIELDLSNVTLLDSIGIRLVVGILRRKSPGGDVRVVRPQFPGAARTLDLLGFGQWVEFAPQAECAGRHT